MECTECFPQFWWRIGGRRPAAGVCGSDGESVRGAWRRSKVKRRAAGGCGTGGGCGEEASTGRMV